jgi:CubicO group peptidase (beta-lactamase class C family)
VEHYIIHTINLLETEVVTQQLLEHLIVRGHHNGEVLHKSDDYVIPFAAGAIIATPKDLILFLQALMNGRLLTQKSLQKMFSDMNLMTGTQSTYYGKGIVAAIGTPVGDIIGHTGGMRGFGAALYYHPKNNLFVAVMMNDDIQPIDPAMFRLMEVMMEE